MDYKKYVKTATQEMRPYIPGEDLKGVSVSEKDTPEAGGMMAIDRDDGSRWYVSKDFYQKNYKQAKEPGPKVIVLCGSTRYCQQMAVVAWYLEKEEGAIVMGLHLLPWWYPGIDDIPDHLAEHEDCKEHCDNLHMSKIDIADEVYVVDVDCYTGNSTKREVAYAESKGLPIRWYTKEPMGLRVDGLYSEAIERVHKHSTD